MITRFFRWLERNPIVILLLVIALYMLASVIEHKT